MILLVDVGNTNIVLGIYSKNKYVACWRISTDSKKTSDEYSIQVMQLFNQANLNTEDIEGIIISSVVPNVMHSLENMIKKCFNKEPIIVGPGIKTGLNIKYDNPKEAGADRIVNAVAAYEKYKKELIIIDFGTATTYCAITKNGTYLGGSICPGIIISSEALFERAAKLPRIELEKPNRIICKNTVEGMQAGTFGRPGMVMISPVSATMKPAPAEILRFLTVTSKSVGAPSFVWSSVKLYCVLATQIGQLPNPRASSCFACF